MERISAAVKRGFRGTFDPTENIKTCANLIAKQLELLRQNNAIEKLRDKKLDIDGKYHKKILKLMIRIAAESDDYFKTVDFITQQVADELKIRCGDGELFAKLLRPGISHEHMVPCEVIYQEILANDLSKSEEIQKILESLSYRALVMPSERCELDLQYQSTMPKLRTINGDYDVLSRYRETAYLGLLIPITSRGADLLKRFTE